MMKLLHDSEQEPKAARVSPFTCFERSHFLAWFSLDKLLLGSDRSEVEAYGYGTNHKGHRNPGWGCIICHKE